MTIIQVRKAFEILTTRQHNKLNQCWFNVGPLSMTLSQH